MRLERELEIMPFDKEFETDGGNTELCHATGIEIYFGSDSEGNDPSEWWNEYTDSEGNLHYGR